MVYMHTPFSGIVFFIYRTTVIGANYICIYIYIYTLVSNAYACVCLCLCLCLCFVFCVGVCVLSSHSPTRKTNLAACMTLEVSYCGEHGPLAVWVASPQGTMGDVDACWGTPVTRTRC